jgi:hypothetical protein
MTNVAQPTDDQVRPNVVVRWFSYRRPDVPTTGLVYDLRPYSVERASPLDAGCHDVVTKVVVASRGGFHVLETALQDVVAATSVVGPVAARLEVAFGCDEGLHRSPLAANSLAIMLHACGFDVTVEPLPTREVS